MEDDQENDKKLKALANIQAEYSEWFSSICTSILYLDERNDGSYVEMPDSFLTWFGKNNFNDKWSNFMSPIMDIYNGMQEDFMPVADSLQQGGKPDFLQFNQFKNSVNGFISSLGKLSSYEITEKSDGKYHSMKSAVDVKEDMNNEMERLSRNGNPFAISMIRVDGYEGATDPKTMLDIVSNTILKCIRPFDDAYFIEDGHFLLSLKHTDMNGVDSAIARLQYSLALDENNSYNATISCCIAEPVEGDDMDELLHSMKNDLENHKDDKEAVLKFLDVSPLQRYVDSQV